MVTRHVAIALTCSALLMPAATLAQTKPATKAPTSAAKKPAGTAAAKPATAALDATLQQLKTPAAIKLLKQRLASAPKGKVRTAMLEELLWLTDGKDAAAMKELGASGTNTTAQYFNMLAAEERFKPVPTPVGDVEAPTSVDEVVARYKKATNIDGLMNKNIQTQIAFKGNSAYTSAYCVTDGVRLRAETPDMSYVDDGVQEMTWYARSSGKSAVRKNSGEDARSTCMADAIPVSASSPAQYTFNGTTTFEGHDAFELRSRDGVQSEFFDKASYLYLGKLSRRNGTEVTRVFGDLRRLSGALVATTQLTVVAPQQGVPNASFREVSGFGADAIFSTIVFNKAAVATTIAPSQPLPAPGADEAAAMTTLARAMTSTVDLSAPLGVQSAEKANRYEHVTQAVQRVLGASDFLAQSRAAELKNYEQLAANFANQKREAEEQQRALEAQRRQEEQQQAAARAEEARIQGIRNKIMELQGELQSAEQRAAQAEQDQADFDQKAAQANNPWGAMLGKGYAAKRQNDAQKARSRVVQLQQQIEELQSQLPQ